MDLFSLDFMPRGQCGNWNPVYKIIYIGSHIGILVMYVVIPSLLVWAVRVISSDRASMDSVVAGVVRSRWKPVVIRTSLFILSCGIGHMEGPVSFVLPIYHMFAVWHLSTNIVSAWALVAMARLINEETKKQVKRRART